MQTFPLAQADAVIRAALAEDVGSGDVTTMSTVPQGTRSRALLVAKESLRLAGLPGFLRTFEVLSPNETLDWELFAMEGDDVGKGEKILTVAGDAHTLLTGERTALNLLQHLSGIATLTAQWVTELEGTRTRLVDTRKTTPGLRALEKYAVRIGGAFNHRFGLSDGVLIKENHIRAAGSITNAVKSARANAPHTLKIEVEVTTLSEVDEALRAGAETLLLDNMDTPRLREAVRHVAGRALLEASGGMTRARLREVAETGVNLISAGSLTHSARSVDLSLLFDLAPVTV